MIKQIRLKNCQSWEDQTIELATDRVNVITAPNNTGKSVLFKLLRLATDPNYCPREEINQLIRTRAEHADFITAFCDGAIGATIIHRNGIIYQYTPSKDVPFAVYDYPPQEYIDNLGLVTNSKGFIANIIDKNQDLLLVESDTRGNEEFMKLLTENIALNEGQLKAREEIEYIKDETSKLQFQIQSVDKQIKDIRTVDIDHLEYNINHSTYFYQALETIISLHATTENIISSQKDDKDYDKILHLLDTLKIITSLQELLSTIDRNNFDIISKCNCILQLLELLQVAEKIKIVVGIPEIFITLVDTLNTIEQLIKSLEHLDYTNYNKHIQMIDAYEGITVLLEQLSVYTNANFELSCINDDINQLRLQLANTTETYTCPIYGEVLYNGKECLPSDI